MYESYTRQSLPSRDYRALLGAALCVFNSNNAFVIEIVLRISGEENGSWFQLMDMTSGSLGKVVREVIEPKYGSAIPDLFSDLVNDRNRIAHSFQITVEHGEQILATKEKENRGGGQFIITEDFLFEFIKKNEKLSSLLSECRASWIVRWLNGKDI